MVIEEVKEKVNAFLIDEFELEKEILVKKLRVNTSKR
jgi:hypothetical protein